MIHIGPKLIIQVIVAIIILLIVIEVIRLLILKNTVTTYKNYWNAKAAEPVKPEDFIYVAMGDSVAQGIGASDPRNSYVGLIIAHIEKTTGRHVHITNVSVTGAVASEVVRDQLPLIKGIKPDLVTLDIGANDVNKKVPTEMFERDYNTILDALPSGKTIVADLPTFERGPKQSVLIARNIRIHEDISRHKFELAPIFDFTSRTTHDWTTYAADFFHPSDKGYRNWYNSFATKIDGVTQQ